MPQAPQPTETVSATGSSGRQGMCNCQLTHIRHLDSQSVLGTPHAAAGTSCAAASLRPLLHASLMHRLCTCRRPLPPRPPPSPPPPPPRPPRPPAPVCGCHSFNDFKYDLWSMNNSGEPCRCCAACVCAATSGPYRWVPLPAPCSQCCAAEQPRCCACCSAAPPHPHAPSVCLQHCPALAQPLC